MWIPAPLLLLVFQFSEATKTEEKELGKTAVTEFSGDLSRGCRILLRTPNLSKVKCCFSASFQNSSQCNPEQQDSSCRGQTEYTLEEKEGLCVLKLPRFQHSDEGVYEAVFPGKKNYNIKTRLKAVRNLDILDDTWKMTLLIASPLLFLAILIVLLLHCCILKPRKQDEAQKTKPEPALDSETEAGTQIPVETQNIFLSKLPNEKQIRQIILLDAVKSCDPTAVRMKLRWQLDTAANKDEMRAALNLASNLLHEKVKMMPAPPVGAIAKNAQYKKQRQQQQDKVNNLNEIIEVLSIKLGVNQKVVKSPKAGNENRSVDLSKEQRTNEMKEVARSPDRVKRVSQVHVATEGTKYYCSNCKISICLSCFK